MTVVHPIARAWISTGGTGAQNYDEFADDAEITAIIAANPDSALAIEMPHRAPESLGKSLHRRLPDAVAGSTQAQGRPAATRRPSDVVVLYRITAARTSAAAYGLWRMVDTDQISTSADEPGLVIRNEDVFIEKVRERVALAEATGHLLSPVLLLQTATGEELHAALARGVPTRPARRRRPTSTRPGAATRSGRWPPGPPRDRLPALAGGGELVVADGNHRSLAAQTGGLPRFLAVVTTPGSVAIQPYHRLVTELDRARRRAGRPAGGRRRRGRASRPPPASRRGARSTLYGRGRRATRCTLPRRPRRDRRGQHRPRAGRAGAAAATRSAWTRATSGSPTSAATTRPAWLRGEVDAGRAELAVLIAPVTVDDFVAVNLARQKMPRKSTWFTPKARGGLVWSIWPPRLRALSPAC